MDRNSAIGLTIIGVLLLAYFYWFGAPSTPPETKPVATTQTPAQTPATNEPQATPVVPDSVLAATYGDFSAYINGEATTTAIENEDIRIQFSSKGGVIEYLELKKFKTYYGQPLVLVEKNSNTFRLTTKYKGEEIDLYQMYYQAATTKRADTTIVTFTLPLSDNRQLVQTYAIPAKGYEIGYAVKTNGLQSTLGEQMSFQWNNFLKPVEKDLADNRNNTTITYYQNGGFDELTPRSNSEKEVLTGGLKWVSIKQKFFLRSLISESSFTSGEIETSFNESDTSVVKRANVTLAMATADMEKGAANYKYYFGPNDYQMIGSVTEDFAKNVYLGWPPVYWINKYVIFPVFNFLTKFISNFGIIIIILVIAIRIILLPLSYRSYLSMAKMRVLKPELDEIKQKHGDDMSKVQSEQLKLYQQVGVNPISGCIPLLLQMPILFAMFYLFPNSIELRQQSFLWAEDLSTYDSIINLPFNIPFYGSHVSLFTLLMTLSTLGITWQNNQVSSVQGPMKSLSYIMPVIFLFVLNTFPSGLSFYYLMSNVATFGQQAIIKRFVDEDKIRAIMDENRKRSLSGTGKKSKFMSKLEDAMKASEEARKKAEEDRKKKKNQQ
jgi:YidC/Oxa1 family membrane protein insertase